MVRKFATVVCAVLFLTVLASSQERKLDLPVIQNYAPPEMNASEQNWVVTTDLRGLVYVGNMDDGILEYDGTRWRKIPLPNKSAVISMATDRSGRIFVGAVREFGTLEPDATGLMMYRSLVHLVDSAERKIPGNVWNTYCTENEVFFSTTRKLYRYSYGDSIRAISLPEHGFWSYYCAGRIFVGNYVQGLLQLMGDSIVSVPGGDFFQYKNITTVLPWKDNLILVGTLREGVYALNPETGEGEGNILEPWVERLFRENSLYHGTILTGGMYSFTTLYGGGGIILDSDLRVLHHLTTENGLREEQLVTSYSAGYPVYSSPLWYATVDGVARVEYNNNIECYSGLSGIRDFVMDITEFGGHLYIATFSGSFRMTVSDKGIIGFQPIRETQGVQNWSFLKYMDPASGSEKLLIGTHQGIYDVDEKNRVRLLDNVISGRSDEKEKFTVYSLFCSPYFPNTVFIGEDSGLSFIEYINGHWTKKIYTGRVGEIRSIAVDRDKSIWIATSISGIQKVTIAGSDTVLTGYGLEQGLPSLKDNIIFPCRDGLVFGTQKGLYRFDAETDSFIPDKSFPRSLWNGSKGVFRLREDMEGNIWLFSYCVKDEVKFHTYELLIPDSAGGYRYDTLALGRLPNVWGDGLYPDSEGTVWFGMADALYAFDHRSYRQTDPGTRYENQPYHALVRKVTANQDSVLFNGTFFGYGSGGERVVALTQPEEMKYVLPFSMRNLDIQWAAPFFEDEGRVLFSYRLLGSSRPEWSKWTGDTEFPFYNLGAGHYTFQVKAVNVYGRESRMGEFAFTIKPPWYFTVLAFLAYGILAVLIVWIIVRMNARRLVREKIRLEGIVRERTAEVVRQKEEIEDSIHYASRIQQALLPSEKVLQDSFPDYFILFKPRDIVSGDFYWVTQKEEKTFVVAADCTGHGVPGAFMSMLGISFLNEVVNIFNHDRASEVLNSLRNLVMTSLKQTGKEDETKDGMDMALMIFDREKQEIQYAGAYNPLYVIRQLDTGEKNPPRMENDLEKVPLSDGKYVLEQISADKMPIGISVKNMDPFTNHVIRYKKGHSFYIFSDGFIDQFGGPDGKKFMSKNFKQLLLSIQDQSMKKQGQILEQKFREWKGRLDQVDDVIIIGIRIN